jgi:hypothetical protein
MEDLIVWPNLAAPVDFENPPRGARKHALRKLLNCSLSLSLSTSEYT